MWSQCEKLLKVEIVAAPVYENGTWRRSKVCVEGIFKILAMQKVLDEGAENHEFVVAVHVPTETETFETKKEQVYFQLVS